MVKKNTRERLYQTIKDIDDMRKALRDAKLKLGLPLGDLDPVAEYLKKMKLKDETPE